MKVTLQIAGGLAPSLMGRQFIVDSASLGRADRQVLEQAVEAALAQPPRPPNQSARDARSFEITVESEAGTRTIVAEDGGMPADLRALVDQIKSLAARAGQKQQ
jgi:hypothetical protein